MYRVDHRTMAQSHAISTAALHAVIIWWMQGLLKPVLCMCDTLYAIGCVLRRVECVLRQQMVTCAQDGW